MASHSAFAEIRPNQARPVDPQTWPTRNQSLLFRYALIAGSVSAWGGLIYLLAS